MFLLPWGLGLIPLCTSVRDGTLAYQFSWKRYVVFVLLEPEQITIERRKKLVLVNAKIKLHVVVPLITNSFLLN